MLRYHRLGDSPGAVFLEARDITQVVLDECLWGVPVSRVSTSLRATLWLKAREVAHARTSWGLGEKMASRRLA